MSDYQPDYPPMPRLSGSTGHSSTPTSDYPALPSLSDSTGYTPMVDPDSIDVSAPDDSRSSFRSTDYASTLPPVRARFPNIDPVYLTKIYRGTIHPAGLVWLDVDRQDATPPDFEDFAHLLYCFEVYGQIICIMASAQGVERELDLQRALSDYRVRLLKLSRVATFESVREWHKAILETQIQDGQDRAKGWMEKRQDLAALLKRQM